MATSAALVSVNEIEAFINEYFGAWQGTDEDRIMSYYSEHVALRLPGTLMQGKTAVLEQFVRPFIAGFPGNRHIAKNMIFGNDVVIVEWSFVANHRGHSLAVQQPVPP
jgi:ketosteroid isomerase-like protein